MLYQDAGTNVIHGHHDEHQTLVEPKALGRLGPSGPWLVSMLIVQTEEITRQGATNDASTALWNKSDPWPP